MQDKELNKVYLETYSREFARQTSTNFFSQQASISGKEITSFCDIIQVNLLVLDSLFSNWQQEMSRLRSPYFDYEATEVKEVLEQLMNTLSRHIQVDRMHLEPLVAHAAASTLRLVLEPYSFFKDVFQQMASQPLTLEALKNRLKFFQLNKFLLQETIQRLESEGIEDVSADSLMIAFDGVFASRKADLEKPEGILEKFSRHVPLSMADLEAVPVKPQPVAQQSFWVDIEQFALAASQPQQTTIAPATTPVVETRSGITPVTSETTPPVQAEMEQPEVAHVMPIDPEPINPTPINPQPVNPEPIKPNQVLPNLNENYRGEKETLNDRFRSNKTETIADQHRKQRIDNLRSAISLNQRFLFVKGLFRGNAEAFQQALTDLEQCSDYPSAVKMLQNKYGTTYGWNQDSEEVQSFLDLIERKF